MEGCHPAGASPDASRGVNSAPALERSEGSECREHSLISHRCRVASTALAALLCGAGCIAPQRPDDVVVLASGADLESANPLVTTHPLSRQVQRYALFVTLLRYDSLLAPQPYFARRWRWSEDGHTLTLALVPDLRWHDGVATTASDAAFTLLGDRKSVV